MHSAASRSADDLNETRRGYEERMCALRSELEQQEVDKAALLDIVQVHNSSAFVLCAVVCPTVNATAACRAVLHGYVCALLSVQAGAVCVCVCLFVCPSSSGSVSPCRFGCIHCAWTCLLAGGATSQGLDLHNSVTKLHTVSTRLPGTAAAHFKPIDQLLPTR